MKDLEPKAFPVKKRRPLQLYAARFAKDVIKELRKTDDETSKLVFFKGKNEIYASWNDFKRYVTEKCLDQKPNGTWLIKPQFRENLKYYGIRMKLDRRKGLLIIRKTKIKAAR